MHRNKLRKIFQDDKQKDLSFLNLPIVLEFFDSEL